MKKSVILSGMFLGIILVFTACNKYEEGPIFSFKSKAARIAGTYTVDKVLKNGEEDEDELENQEACVYTCKKDGGGEYRIGQPISFNGNLEWKLNSDQTELLLRIENPFTNEWEAWETNEIIKLTDNEMWLIYYDNDEIQWEYHYVE